jgi:hypothetical protein
MTVLHLLTEESSIKNVFEIILPKILPQDVSFNIYPHQGKQDLENAMKKTVPSISKIPGAKILVAMDQDEADCLEVKRKLLEIMAGKCHCEASVRIICKELESWFLGDIQAIEKAFPGFKMQQYAGKSELRNVDGLSKPSHHLLRMIPEYSNRERLPKLDASQKIAPYLDIEHNRSVSFNQTISAIKKLVCAE